MSLLFHFPLGSDWYSCKLAIAISMTYLEESRDVALDDLGDISLEVLHQRSGEFSGGLATGVALCQRQHNIVMEPRNTPAEGSKSRLMYSIGSSSNCSSSLSGHQQCR